MEEKDLTPEITGIKTEEVVAEATTDEVVTREAEPVVTEEIAESNDTKESAEDKKDIVDSQDNVSCPKPKKDKKPMPKKKKITIITACSIVGATVLGLLIWLLVMLLSPMPPQDLSSIPLKVDMADDYYVGTEGNIDLSKIFPECSDFEVSKNSLKGNILTINGNDKFTLSFTDKDGKKENKNVTVIANAVNVNDFNSLQSNIADGKAVVIQNSYIAVPKLAGTDVDQIPALTVTNNVYGNGAIVNLFELVASRNKPKNNKVSEVYLKGNGDEGGATGFNIKPREDGAQVIFQDVHIKGNDMNREKGGNLEGLSEDDVNNRGLLLFSKYGDLLHIQGDESKSNALVKHCVIENGHKVVHVINANVDLQGTIIRNASDTALSVATEANHASYIKSKNNVIANSLTGAVLFYCMDGSINESNAAESWNTLEVVERSFLDIYNWKKQTGLSFLPETEGFYANIANMVVGSTITSKDYDKLKVEDKEGEKYIHFAIIRLKTADGIKNGSTVKNYKNLGYTTSVDNGFKNGFPIPNFATGIVKDIDVWGYYGNSEGAVGPLDGFNEKMLPNLYKELREGR